MRISEGGHYDGGEELPPFREAECFIDPSAKHPVALYVTDEKGDSICIEMQVSGAIDFLSAALGMVQRYEQRNPSWRFGDDGRALKP